MLQFDLNLPDIAEVWRRGSVIASRLLDLTAAALLKDPTLSTFDDRVSDSGEGRWTIKAAIDEGVPVPVLSTGALLAFQLARRGGVCRQALVRDAIRIRRTYRESRRQVTMEKLETVSRMYPSAVARGNR